MTNARARSMRPGTRPARPRTSAGWSALTRSSTSASSRSGSSSRAAAAPARVVGCELLLADLQDLVGVEAVERAQGDERVERVRAEANPIHGVAAAVPRASSRTLERRLGRRRRARPAVDARASPSAQTSRPAASMSSMSTGRSRAVASSSSIHRRTGRSPSRSRDGEQRARVPPRGAPRIDAEALGERREVAREQQEQRVADVLGRRRGAPTRGGPRHRRAALRAEDGQLALERVGGDSSRVERLEVGQEAPLGLDLASIAARDMSASRCPSAWMPRYVARAGPARMSSSKWSRMSVSCALGRPAAAAVGAAIELGGLPESSCPIGPTQRASGDRGVALAQHPPRPWRSRGRCRSPRCRSGSRRGSAVRVGHHQHALRARSRRGTRAGPGTRKMHEVRADPASGSRPLTPGIVARPRPAGERWRGPPRGARSCPSGPSRSATSPAAARTPTWRMPPPTSLRARRARPMKSRSPTTTEPTGQASPFDRQNVAESALGEQLGGRRAAARRPR